MKVPVLLMCSLHAPTQQTLEASYEVHRYYEAADPKALLASLAGRCEIAVTSGGRGIEAAVMSQLPRLKLVSCFGVGVDAIDVGHARADGDPVLGRGPGRGPPVAPAAPAPRPRRPAHKAQRRSNG